MSSVASWWLTLPAAFATPSLSIYFDYCCYFAMEPEVEFTFCQSDLPCIAFTTFEEMQKKGEFCDLTIKLQNYSISAHRVILAAVIPYFRSVFSCSGAETEEKDIAMGNLDPRAIEVIIRFAYSSKVNISTENVQSLLAASQFLQLSQVQDACVEFLIKRLSVGNVLQVRTFALSLNNTNLIENSNSYIRENFDEFSKSGDFVELPHSRVKEIISEDDLNVSCEEIVLDAVMTWVKKSPSVRCGFLPELLSEVRMIYIASSSLKQISREELVRSSPCCRDLLEEVKSHHLWPEERSLFSNLNLQPRKNYALNKGIFAVCLASSSGSDIISVYYLDFVKEVWHNLASKTLPFSACYNVMTLKEKIYVLADSTIQCFDPKTHEWKSIECTYPITSGSLAVSHKNMIYILGCKSSGSSHQVYYCFDTQYEKCSKQTKMKTFRSFADAASLGECIYITGGIDSQSIIIDTAEKYNSSTSEWSEIAPMHNKRYCHACSSMNGKIYVCGGIESSTAEMYDPLSDQWSFISSMRGERYGFSLLSLNNQLYALGNRGSKDKVGVEIYDSESDQWKPSFSLPAGFSAAVLMQYIKQ